MYTLYASHEGDVPTAYILHKAVILLKNTTWTITSCVMSRQKKMMIHIYFSMKKKKHEKMDMKWLDDFLVICLPTTTAVQFDHS